MRIALVGATGLVGEMVAEVLDAREFPVTQLHALAGDGSIGHSIAFHGRPHPVGSLDSFDFASADLAFFCAGAQVARAHAPRAVAAGCRVIDSSSAFRQDLDVPLVVPEVNPETLEQYAGAPIIASPSGATVPLAIVLRAIHAAVGLESAQVATYQAVSGAGRDALETLAQQSAQLLGGQGRSQSIGSAKSIAFQCVPLIGELADQGHSTEELAIVRETARLLGEPGVALSATAVRVPVFFGDSQVVHLQTREQLDAQGARDLLSGAVGIEVADPDGSDAVHIAPTEAANRDTVCVARIREDLPPATGLNLWIVADNVRRGAATNSVQIAEILVRQHM